MLSVHHICVFIDVCSTVFFFCRNICLSRLIEIVKRLRKYLWRLLEHTQTQTHTLNVSPEQYEMLFLSEFPYAESYFAAAQLCNIKYSCLN